MQTFVVYKYMYMLHTHVHMYTEQWSGYGESPSVVKPTGNKPWCIYMYVNSCLRFVMCYTDSWNTSVDLRRLV